MECGSKIIILLLTTLIVCALYITQNLHVTPLKALVGFTKTPSPSPSPAPAPAPRLHHAHKWNYHHLPRPVPPSDETDDERRLVAVAILVSACAATCMIFLIILFTCFTTLRTRRKAKSTSKSMSMNMSMNTNDLDQSNNLEDHEAKHKVTTLRNILSNSENLEEQVGSDSYVESFDYFYNSHDSSNSIASNVSVSCDMLLPSTSTLPSSSYSGSNPTVTVLHPLPPPPTGKDGTPRPPDRSMIWDQLKSSSFDYNIHNANDDLKNKSPSPGKHVLEPKRLQNLTILIKALNATAEQVCCALIRGSGLNPQQLEVLKRMELTKEEEAKIAGYKGDLGSAETFIATILTIPYAFQRIHAMLYRETFDDEVAHLRTTFLVLEEACKELRTSRLFLKLLEAVFKLGNRMNVNIPRGGAKPFKLKNLLNLANQKGSDGKTTLLHFVVQEIVRSEGVRASESIIGRINQKNKHRTIQDKEDEYRNMGLELVGGLSTELCNVKKTATIDSLSVIASTISNLSQGLARLRTLVKQDTRFGECMQSFLNYGVKQLKELHEDEHKVLELVKQMNEYFHGSMSKDDENPLHVFVIVRSFLVMLDRVCRELRRSKVFTHQNLVVALQ